MPVMSGTELCKAVKQQFNHVKVLIFSMYNSEPVIKKNILAEADVFILKTSGKEELLEAFHKIADNSMYFSLTLIPTISELIKKRPAACDKKNLLTEREIEILKLIVKEKTSEQMAQILNISKKTIDHHRARLLDKTACPSTIGLVKYALLLGIE